MAFYKNSEGVLLVAPNFVYAPNYTLLAASHTEYTYPVDGWVWADTQEAAMLALGMTAGGYNATTITKLAFRSRFTQAEKLAVEMAQLDNPSASQEQRTLAAGIRVSEADLAASDVVDLSDPRTIAGVQALETYSILATGRAVEILQAPVLNSERPVQ